jgi:flagellin
LNTEYEYLFSEIDRITDNSRYNSTIDILASTDSDFVLQVGILGNADNRISLDLTRLNSDTTSIGLNTALSIETKDNGLAALTVIDTALESISDKRNYAGSFITRLESTLGEATNSDENMSGSVSRIDDVDYAMESARSAQSQILTQASVAALAQAKNMNLSHFQSIFANL